MTQKRVQGWKKHVSLKISCFVVANTSGKHPEVSSNKPSVFIVLLQWCSLFLLTYIYYNFIIKLLLLCNVNMIWQTFTNLNLSVVCRNINCQYFILATRLKNTFSFSQLTLKHLSLYRLFCFLHLQSDKIHKDHKLFKFSHLGLLST